MKALKPGDFVETDVITNKQFVLSETSSFLTVLEGNEFSGSFYIESASKTTNNIFKGPLYHSIKSQFYQQEYKPDTTQSLNQELTLIQVSQSIFDEKILEGSVTLIDNTLSATFVDDSVGNLKLSGSTTHVGNVFYEFGSIVITDTGSYKNLGLGEFDLTLRVNHTKKVLNLQATVEPNEFNYSTNPTMRIRGATTFDRPRYSYTLEEVSQSYSQSIDFNTIIPEFFGYDPSGSVSSSLTPYVTTIGWYDETGDLLAAAKLATPTPIPRDFPITFKAKIDI
mgnify:CR=1 FL=1